MALVSWLGFCLYLHERCQRLRPAEGVRCETLRIEMNVVAEPAASVETVGRRSFKHGRHRRKDFSLPCHNRGLSFGGGFWCRME